MGSYCTKGFFRKQVGGSLMYPIKSSNAYCDKCKVVAKSRVTPKSSSFDDERGTLITSWEEIKLKCPRCKRTGVYNDNHRETDGTYYSNEERRVHGIPNKD